LFQWLKICIAFRPKDLADQKSRSYSMLFETSQRMDLITEKRISTMGGGQLWLLA
jgi:hypothetical protein